MRRFWSDRQGNIAVLFALAIVPVVGAMGAAVDYSLANAYRTDMQKALDAAALAVSKLMPLEQSALDAAAMEFFAASLGPHSMINLAVTATPQQGSVLLRASGDYKPALANLFGATQFEIGANSEARWGIDKVEVALVLDNSGSMGSHSRMTHLKAAANDLLEVLESAARNPGDAKVAIIPFDQRVNVGTTYVNADWLNWSEWDEEHGHEEGVTTCTEDGNGKGKGKGQEKSSGKGKGKGKGGGSHCTIDHSSWNGCVIDRDQNHDVQDTAPTSDSRRYLASQCHSDVSEMRRLTYDWTSLRATVNAMQPAGMTNITIGLAWGWHLLSPTDVATEGAAYGTEHLTKYIILMSDGDNTRNRWTSNKGSIDDRTEEVCDNIKDEDIQVYTIRLVSGNASLLRNCATSEAMYYDVQDASQLSAIFSGIASQIASLHLSK